jgi:hypothetical protein
MAENNRMKTPEVTCPARISQHTLTHCQVFTFSCICLRPIYNSIRPVQRPPDFGTWPHIGAPVPSNASSRLSAFPAKSSRRSKCSHSHFVLPPARRILKTSTTEEPKAPIGSLRQKEEEEYKEGSIDALL